MIYLVFELVHSTQQICRLVQPDHQLSFVYLYQGKSSNDECFCLAYLFFSFFLRGCDLFFTCLSMPLFIFNKLSKCFDYFIFRII